MRKIKKSIRLTVIVLVLTFMSLVLLLLYLYELGGLSGREFGTALLMVVGCFFGIVVFLLSGHLSTQSGRISDRVPTDEMHRLVRRVRATVIALPVILVFAAWVTRDQPLLPRLIGAAINVLITCWLLVFLRRVAHTNHESRQ